MKTVLVAPFDGTSRVPGASAGAAPLLRALNQAQRVAGHEPPWRELALGDASKSSRVWGHRLRRLAEANDVALTLGGDHFVTYPVVEALLQRVPQLRLVVLDAHHDAYDYPLLTHFSLFHHLATRFGVPILIVGARHELDQASGVTLLPMRRCRELGALGVIDACVDFVADHPLYLSIDLDVIDPASFPGVSDRIDDGMPEAQFTEVTRALLERRPIAMDVVEYNALRDTDGAPPPALVGQLFSEIVRWLV